VVRSFRRGAVAAVLALSLAPLAAACAAGNDAATLEVQPDSASASAGPVTVQNAYVLTQTDGPATVSARLFNNGSSNQTLQSVQLGGGVTATLSGKDGGRTVTVPPHGTVLLGGKGNAAATVATGQEALRDGDVQTAVFTFSGAGPLSVPANVTPAVGFLEPYGPSSTPTTTAPTPTATPLKPTTTPNDTATPTGTPTP
jgi:hypothetical protein